MPIATTAAWLARDVFIKRATGRNRNAPALARGQTLTDLLRSSPD